MGLFIGLKAGSFVSAVHREAKKPSTSVVFISADGQGWPEMKIAEFRRLVLHKLKEAGRVKKPRFSPPDSYDGWTFSAYPIKRTPENTTDHLS